MVLRLYVYIYIYIHVNPFPNHLNVDQCASPMEVVSGNSGRGKQHHHPDQPWDDQHICRPRKTDPNGLPPRTGIGVHRSSPMDGLGMSGCSVMFPATVYFSEATAATLSLTLRRVTHASRNKCIPLVTSALLVVTSATLVVTRS